MRAQFSLTRGIAAVVSALALCGCSEAPPLVSVRGDAFTEAPNGPDGGPATGPEVAPDGPSPPVVDVSGRWAMFAFEDPLAVELTQTGNVLTGIGCYAGLPRPEDARSQSCAELRGKIDGAHVQFALDSTFIPYAADVYVSADGARMAGRFHNTGGWVAAMAWLRIGPNDQWLPLREAPLVDAAVEAHKGGWALLLVGAEPDDTDLAEFGFSLSLDVWGGRGAMLSGPLGSFCRTEMTWNEATQTLVMGPVPATSPRLPVQVTLTFEQTTLLGVEALMPTGTIHHFTARR